MALVVAIGQAEVFKNGRHFAAFIGSVPRQCSSGKKERLLGLSKRGDSYLRQLLIHGAPSAVLRSSKKTDAKSLWINRLKARCNHNCVTVAVAVANKNARVALALLKKGETYEKAS